ncbi:MAG: hypothetical protein NTW96_14520 [Planctomycetia bacterium]|nr:hypothetical protein [Planctomycetia bacterium]
MIRLLQVIRIALSASCWRAGLGVLVILACGVGAHAQGNGSAEYKVYSLKHKTAAEVERTLGQMLAGQGPAVHLVADTRTNQILLRGPDSAQQIARQLIDSVDRPPTPALAPQAPVAAAAAAESSVVEAYTCPRARLAEAADRLRGAYGETTGVRVAVDDPTSQLFVLAPPSVHADIRRQLVAMGLRAETPADSPRPTEAAVPRERFVPLAHSRVEQIEPKLRELLGPRLRPVENRRPEWPDYWLEIAPDVHVDLSIDRRCNGVMLFGPEALLNQLASLVGILDGFGQPSDKAVHVIPIRHADPAKVREALEAYRSGQQDDRLKPLPRGTEEPNPAEAQPASDSQSYYRPGQDRRRRYSPEGVDLVNYEMLSTMLQQPGPAAGPAPVAPGPVPLAPAQSGIPVMVPGLQMPPSELQMEQQRQQRLRELGRDVEVQILPDLDVIILQGRERDVQEMARIIAEIERLSAETEPVIEIVPLSHVLGTSMATLISQVSEDLIGGRQGRVTITPLVKPNSLLLIGWGEAVKAIKELIQKLDQPVPPQTQFRVFRLRHAPAARVQTTIAQFFTGGAGLSPRVTVTSDVRTNSLVVHASPRDMDEVALLIARIDSDTSAAVSRAKIFKLKNALAADLGATLQSAIAAARGGQAAGEKSTILEMLAVDAEGARMLRSGILDDVQVVPDMRTNSLFVSAPAESLQLIETLIDQLDSPAVVAQIKVFQVVNGDANDLVRTLRSLLPTQQTGAAARPELPVAEGETSLAPVRFSVDTRTNTIIATGSRGDLAIIEALLLRLDAKDVAQRKNTVYRLKNAPATDVARAINDFLRSERQVARAAPGSESPFQQIEREVVVVPETVSNALIISATPRFFKDITDLVEKLDAQPPQVLIQVVIAEVELDNMDEFGVELGLQDSLLFDRSLLSAIESITTTTQKSDISGITTQTEQTIVSAENTPGYNFTTNPLGNSGADKALANAQKVGGQSISNFGVGRMNNELGFGGLVLSASSESVSVLVRALQECRRLDVLSRPQIMTLDNQPAFIQVGQRVPRITGTTINETGQVNNIQMEDVGLILGVTPRISPEGMVVMELDAEKSELGPQLEGIPVSISEGTVIKSPIVNVTTAQTTVSAASGETIVLGGLITKTSRVVHRRVPWLSDVPLLGMLFKYDSTTQKRTELLIIMTPWVVRGPEEAERVKRREAARMNWCLGDVNSMHGDTGLYDLGNDASYAGRTPPAVYPDMDGPATQGAPPMPGPSGPTPPPGQTRMPPPENVPTPLPTPIPTPMPGDLNRLQTPAPAQIRQDAKPADAAAYVQPGWSNPAPVPVYQAQSIPTGLPQYPKYP